MKSQFSILCLLVNILLISCEQAPQYYEVSGRLHTPYHIKFEHTKPLDKEIDEQLKYFYHLFNAFDSTSVISQVNQNRDIRVDTLFQKVFKKALEVSTETNGAYDVTCAPLIKVWLQPEGKRNPCPYRQCPSVYRFSESSFRRGSHREGRSSLNDELFFFGGWNGLRYDSPNAGEERGP